MSKQIKFLVFLNNELIDEVYYDANCTERYVRNTLINHDGYDSEIIVKKA